MDRKINHKIINFCLGALLFTSCTHNKENYRNTELSFEERVEDLLTHLSIQEKVDLLRYDSPEISRLGIPAHNFWNECLHGVARAGLATVFPQAIGMAAMWDTKEMNKIGIAISDEARAKHHDFASQGKRGIYQGLTYWTPNINIFRDPRWGRGMETYGEDPFLTAEMAIPFIKGLQGEDPDYFKLIATVKHFVVHSGPESSRHSFDVWPSDYDLAETYLPHFKRTIQEAKAYSVMCAYQRFRGEPCCGSKFLDNLLREQWQFDGYVVSDCWAIRDFYKKDAHMVRATPEEAAVLAVQSGTDLNCGDTYPYLVSAYKQGLITEEELDVSVRRMLLARMKLGQFDPHEKVSYANIPYNVVDSKAHQELALDAARKSMVLLKNDNNLLPLSKNVKRIAVIGPNADDLEVLLGNYNGYPSNPKTPLAGIREKAPQAEVVYAQGCQLAEALPHLLAISPEYLFTDASKSIQGLNAAYFDNKELKGRPFKKTIDTAVDFVWGNTAPLLGISTDLFSVRWSGVITPPVTGKYALGGEGFSAFNLYLNDSLLTKWNDKHHPKKVYEYVNLEAGKSYPIRIEYTQNNSTHSMMRLLWDIPKPDLKEEALELARNSDVVILCMGLSPLLEGEEMTVKVDGFDGGDRVDIQLPKTQTDLIREIHKLKKPTVLVLLNGSALALNWEAENIPAILEAWYPGQSGGTAIADILFGDYNPSGRLPITFYQSIDQIPAFENYEMEGKTYRYFSGEPLYEFGYGLSFTTYSYALKEFPAMVTPGENIRVGVDVTNTGKMDGEEIVQLYVSLPDSKLQKPIRALQGFERVDLKVGETKRVYFELTPSQFAARDDENLAVVEAGRVQISVGGKQPDLKAIASKQVVLGSITVKGDSYYVAE